ncbi:MAG: hypothetical protein H3C34_11365 [Caldilineaceae bacterium]|nr:hypothetical protein [Caldilineaceae bacterium]
MISAHHRQNIPDQEAHHRAMMSISASTPGAGAEIRVYNLAVVPVGDGDKSRSPRAILTSRRHQSIVEYISQRLEESGEAVRTDPQLDKDAQDLAQRSGLSTDRVRRLLPADARQPHPLTRPFVLRAARGEIIRLQVTNLVPGTELYIALVDDDFGIQRGMGQIAASGFGETSLYTWHCTQPGIYPIYNSACTDAQMERCLLGVLMIEP